MPNGSIDPWHALSILQSGPGITTIYIIRHYSRIRFNFDLQLAKRISTFQED